MKFEDLPEKQQKFVDLYLDNGDRDAAYKDAGYSIAGRAWKANARKLFRNLTVIIEERINTRIGEGAVMALKIIRDIMEDDDVAPAVRLKAAQDYLSRGGRDRPKEAKLIIADEKELTDEELDLEIRSLHGRIQDGKTGTLH